MTENPQEPREAQPGSDAAITPASGQPDAGSSETAITSPTGTSSPAEQQTPQAPGVSPEAAPSFSNPDAATGTVPTVDYPAAPSTSATEPIPAAFARQEDPAADDAPKSKRRGLVLPVVAALAVGAIIGGISGAGVTLLSRDDSSGNSSATGSSSSMPTNITVNDAADATTVTAVAATASPSVVTISVAGSTGAGTGSGVILSEDGYVLTNTHVVTLDGSSSDGSVQVQTSDGKLFSATVVGTDPISDLAVIKLEGASGLTVASWADSSQLNVGDTAIAIGAPLGLAGTVTDGIVSALNRSITVASSAVPEAEDDPQQQSEDGESDSPYDFWNFDVPGEDSSSSQASGSVSLSVIQTDAAINPGNSGGALLNAQGEVIGINVAIANAGSSTETTSGSIGVGFALPSNLAQRVAKEIIADGSATHGLLGASVGDANASEDGTSTLTTGALISSTSPAQPAVTAGGAADTAGLQEGDIVTEFNGVQIHGATDLTAQVRALPAGATASLTYQRDGEPTTVEVTLGALEL